MKSLSSYSSAILIQLKISWHSQRLDHRTDNLRTFLCTLFFHPCYFQGFVCLLSQCSFSMFVCSSSSQWLCVACPKSDSATGGTGGEIQILRRDGKLPSLFAPRRACPLAGQVCEQGALWSCENGKRTKQHQQRHCTKTLSYVVTLVTE